MQAQSKQTETHRIYEAQTLLRLTDQPINKNRLAKTLGLSRNRIGKKLKELQMLILDGNLYQTDTELTSISPLKIHKLESSQSTSLFKRLHDSDPYRSDALFTNNVTYAKRYQLLLGDGINNLTDSINLNRYNVKSILAVSLMDALSNLKYFPTGLQVNSKLQLSKSLVDISVRIANRGRVHNKSKSLRYLLSYDKLYKFTQLFVRKGAYVPGLRSSKTFYTDYFTDTVMPAAVKHFLSLPFSEVSPADSDLIVQRIAFQSITARNLFIMMSNLKGVDSQGNYVLDYAEIDRQYSRKYNLFTSLQSDARKSLDYSNYDGSAMLQSIVLQKLDADKYPYHKLLTTDKHRLRNHIAQKLGVTTAKVKVMLTSSDNGKRYKKYEDECRVFRRYVSESTNIAAEYNQYMKANHVLTYSRALSMAKPETGYRKVDGYRQKVILPNTINKFSLFFFNWTQEERVIRDVMRQSFANQNDVREVHDAVYSKESVDISVMEHNVLVQTGYVIKIEVEAPTRNNK